MNLVPGFSRPARWAALAGALLAAPLTWCAEAPAVQVWVSTGWAPPFLMSAADGARRGLIPDWYAALGQALGRRLQISYVPQRRLARDGSGQHLDLRCFGSRSWLAPDEQAGYQDTARPFVAVDEVIAGAAQGPAVHDVAALQGRNIGTVATYAYPTLDAGFASGAFRRDNAPDELAMLRKQLQGRTDFVVVRRWTLEHLQRQDPAWRALRAMPLRVSRVDLYCGVSPGGTLPLAALEAAQERLLRDGTLARLLDRYGLSR